MPFPYAFPFAFDNVLASSEVGLGAEIDLSLVLLSIEQGSGLEGAPDKAAQTGETGAAADALKTLIRKEWPAPDLRLYGKGRTGRSSGRVNKSSRRVNL